MPIRECAAAECSTSCSSKYGRCLEHLEFEELSDELAHSRKSGKLNGRGVHFTRELVDRIRECTPPGRIPKRPGRDRFRIGIALAPDDGSIWSPNFQDATFSDSVTFSNTIFGPQTNFQGAEFRGVPFNEAKFGDHVSFRTATFERANFQGASFGNQLNMSGASFDDGAIFSQARFLGMCMMTDTSFGNAAIFDGAHFNGEAGFVRAIFGDTLSFRGTHFRGPASFTHARIGDDADFTRAIFKDACRFLDATFGDRVVFLDAQFFKNALFADTKFGGYADLGPLQASGIVGLHRARFAAGGTIAVQCQQLTVERADFADGITIRAAKADIDCRGANFGSPSTITTIRPSDRYVAINGDSQQNARLSGLSH